MVGKSLSDIAHVLNPNTHPLLSSSIMAHGVSASSAEDCLGKIFVAVKGSKHDGHNFVQDALAKGAVAVVVEDDQGLSGKPYIMVPDSRRALSRLAAFFHDQPSERMSVVGVTGTNGKTTTNWLIYNLLLAAGVPSMRLGTLGLEAFSKNGKPSMSRKENLTTPDPTTIHADLSQGLTCGVHACVMEVSSHALVQSRVDDIHFDAAVFTNLSRDHLDFHRDMDEYFLAKKQLFYLLHGSLKPTKGAIINSDSAYGQILLRELSECSFKILSFGREKGSTVRISSFEQDTAGSLITFEHEGATYKVTSPFIGVHNGDNLVGALLACATIGIDLKQMLSLTALLPQVPGRLEAVGTKEIGIYVDYAHTPDALSHALRTLRPITRKKLWVVFGCGGDRDKGKRPEMAKIACGLADKVVITSDNPRTENPLSIIEDILSGADSYEAIEPDRRQAISLALSGAGAGDVVLIAGKGHEDYQIIGTVKYPFSDQEEVRKLIL